MLGISSMTKGQWKVFE